jgi:uncharacterized protein (DUF1501 family)
VSDSSPRCRGCSEYHRLTRRAFLHLGGGALAGAVVPAWLPRVAFATEPAGDRDVLVSIVLQGGCDSLAFCPPFGDPDYYRHRSALAIPPPDSISGPRAIDLDGFFGLAPALEPLMEAYQEGALLVLQACGLPQTTRSHFHAVHSLEVGVPEPPPSLTDGWIARHLQAVAPDPGSGLLRGVSLGAGLPRRLAAAPATVSLPDPLSRGLGEVELDAEWLEALEAVYRASGDLHPVATTSVRTLELLEQVGLHAYQGAGGAVYPEDPFGLALKSAAALIRAEVGVEAVAIDHHGWDTHEHQRPLDGGMAALMDGFARGIAAFHRDLAAAGHKDVVVVVTSEFGRTVFENGSGGTEHGLGGVMLVLGDGVLGGRVLTHWPGLHEDVLHEGIDLPVTLDARDVLAEVLERRLGNPHWELVFPDPAYIAAPVGAIR